MSEKIPPRRTFLKGAAATLAASTVVSQAGAQEKAKGKGGGKPAGGGVDKVIPRPGSDFMVDVMKSLGIDYVASNPASSFRSLHESIVNYGGNKKPEFLTCLHEESSVAMAHGYYKASGKPMAILAHSSVGLQHAAMAVYNAWCDRVPVILMGGNFMDAAARRPGVEWSHCSQYPAALLRDYIKWDDQPASLQHFAESTVRAYKMAMTPPMEPVLIIADGMLQEHAIEDEKSLFIPKLSPSAPPMGESGAVREAAKLLAAAENPVIVAERVTRNQEGMKLMVELAEALNAPVVNQLGRMNFPTTHYLARTQDGRALVREADVILFLEVGDPWGQMNSISDPHHQYRRVAKSDVKTIHVTLADQIMRSNYQDMQRFCPVDVSISADAQATLPSLVEEVRKVVNKGKVAA